jgi:hypothetical protein
MKKTITESMLRQLINKEIKELDNKSSKLIKESKAIELAELINKAIDKVDEELSYVDFAIAVGKILREEYGTHLYKDFFKELNNELKKKNT